MKSVPVLLLCAMTSIGEVLCFDCYTTKVEGTVDIKTDQVSVEKCTTTSHSVINIPEVFGRAFNPKDLRCFSVTGTGVSGSKSYKGCCLKGDCKSRKAIFKIVMLEEALRDLSCYECEGDLCNASNGSVHHVRTNFFVALIFAACIHHFNI